MPKRPLVAVGAMGTFGEDLHKQDPLCCLDKEQTKVVRKRKSKLKRPVPHPVLIRDPNFTLPKMTPSRFLFELKLSMEERLAHTNMMRLPKIVELLDTEDASVHKASQVNIGDPLFQPFPSEMYFQNFEPLLSYELPLELRNNDVVPRQITVSQVDSPYFKIIKSFDQKNKVGSGIIVTFYIQFTPDQKKDYEHELICITDREKFVVPVHALGARAILDFPDDIHFGSCIVKHPVSRTLLIRNIGNGVAKFTLATEIHEKNQNPFSVIPEAGVLAVDNTVQVTVGFKPQLNGNHHGKLVINYDTGEKVYVSLYGAASDASIHLEKSSIFMETTFITMSSERTVTINNHSDVIAHFHWTQHATPEEETQRKHLNHINMKHQEHEDTERLLDECILDPSLRDKISILTRTFHNKCTGLHLDKLLFENEVIRIIPLEGDIWPNSSFDVKIFFNPKSPVQYSCTAFCEITGRQSRLPLRIRGEGLGPKVELSLDKIDMSNIFIGSYHVFETVIINKGLIDAKYHVLPNNSFYGSCFDFEPATGVVVKDGFQALKVTFSSRQIGDFCEHFAIQVDFTAEPLMITFNGSVIAPTFHVDIPALKFGTVSYGFKNVQTCTLVNSSLIPISFKLRIPGDGKNPSINAEDDLDLDDPSLAGSPCHGLSQAKEFEIIPSSGTIEAQSSLKVQVALTSNRAWTYENALVVDVDGIGSELFSVSISARCITPHVCLVTPELNFGRCFLRFPYQQNVQLYNESDLPAKYIVLPQKRMQDTNPNMLYSSPKAKGIVAPHAVCEVPIEIQPQEVELQKATCSIVIFGSQQSPLKVDLCCIGEGPVVHVIPSKRDWGTIPVLMDFVQTILLKNESFITAYFTTEMARPNSVFRVSPASGNISPESSETLTITAHLEDSVRFQDKLLLHFVDSQTRVVHLFAVGQGTTIVSEPPIAHCLDFGPNFSQRPLVRIFKLTNQGRRHHQIIWSTEKPNKAIRNTTSNTGNLTSQHKNSDAVRSSSCDLQWPVFTFTPVRFELKQGESIDFRLEGCVSEPRYVSEHLLCHAVLGNSGGKELIMRVELSANFISPVLQYCSKKVSFRVDQRTAKDKIKEQTQTLELTNVSTLPLTVILALRYPFSLLSQLNKKLRDMEVYLASQEKHTLTIGFDPAYMPDLNSRDIDDVLHVSFKEHPHVETIALRGEVNFPNLSFEKTTVNFGCILNDTEVTRFVNMTNISPVQVKYRWSFQMNQSQTRRIPGRLIPTATDTGHGDANIDTKEEAVQEMSEETAGKAPRRKETEKEQVGEGNLTVGFQNDDTWKDQRKPPCDAQSQQEWKESAKQEGKEGGLGIMSIGNRMMLRGEEEKALQNNPVLMALLEPDASKEDCAGVQEVFDIMPLYGSLKPGETEQMTFTFFGHTDVWGEAKAICEVEGGPSYEIVMMGEASFVEYRFDSMTIDFGKQMYDIVAVKEVTLQNTGRVALEYVALDVHSDIVKSPLPGCPVVVPSTGVIEPFSMQKIQIRFLPGVPEKFEKSFSIQVAHFKPDVISLHGEGVFPQISLDLSRYVDEDGLYQRLLEEACQNLMPEDPKVALTVVNNSDQKRNKSSTILPSDSASSALSLINRDQNTRLISEREIQTEVDRLAVKEFAVQQNMRLKEIPHLHVQHRESSELEDQFETSKDMQDNVDIVDLPLPPAPSDTKNKKTRPKLPDYIFDFGYVILGSQATQMIHTTNTGWWPVSFKVKHHGLRHLGFFIEVEQVRNLPGHETVDIAITFDPKAANLPLGPVEAQVNLQVTNGPDVGVRLQAIVTMPSMETLLNSLQFGEVKVGECCVMSTHLYNSHKVPCEWFCGPTSSERRQTLSNMPPHLRRKAKQEQKMQPVFEVLPACGNLNPGQRVSILIKFQPREQRTYEQNIVFRIKQSVQRVVLKCCGSGLEPRLIWEPSTVMFGPILSYSAGHMQEVVVRNPCSFPVEFYSLEMDKQYLDEEKVLRLVPGYDKYNQLLLPTRNAGEKLTPELLDHFEEQMKKYEEEERVREEARLEELYHRLQAAQENQADKEEEEMQGGMAAIIPVVSEPIMEEPETPEVMPLEVTVTESQELEHNLSFDESGAVDLDSSPVSMAITRHLGLDTSSEGKAIISRGGIAIILHGAPSCGKSTAAVMLAQHYDAAILTIDGAVIDAIANGTRAGLLARQVCIEAAREAEEADKKTWPETTTLSRQHSGVREKEKLSTQTAKTVMFSLLTPVDSCQIHAVHGPVQASQRLDIPGYPEEEGLISCVLPENLLIEILSERLQLSDCLYGVVFDGLESLFAQSMFAAANIILKALNSRRFIFFCTLKLDFDTLKEREKQVLEEKENQERQAEEEEIVRLEEMDEEEYEALGEQEKKRTDQKRHQLKIQRLERQQAEKRERERQKREEREEEERRKEEEMKCKKGKKKVPESKDSKDKKTHADSKHLKHATHSEERVFTEKKGGKNADGNLGNDSALGEEGSALTEVDLLLHQRFHNFETSQKDISGLIELWDPSAVQLRHPQTPEKSDEMELPSSGRKGKGRGEKVEKEKHKRQEKEPAGKAAKEVANNTTDDDSMDGNEGEPCVHEEERVPHIHVDCSNFSIPAWQQILDIGLLPTKEEILTGMGKGSLGGPIPPPVTFAVVSFPVRRSPTPFTQFPGQFIINPLEEMSPTPEEEKKERLEEDLSLPDKFNRKESTQASGKGKKAMISTSPTDAGKVKDSGPGTCLVSSASIPQSAEATTPASEPRKRFRWIVPAKGQVSLRLHFLCEEPGEYEQVFKFEIVGTRRCYNLLCHGLCAFPTITKEPRIVFPHCRSTFDDEEIVHKKFILSASVFEFGPLQVGAIREKHKEGKTSKNIERLYIHNCSSQDAHVAFCLLNDFNEKVFHLETHSAFLIPGSSIHLHIGAFPQNQGQHDDVLVCCIRENPEPVLFNISCVGVRTELEVDKKLLQFDKVLIHRKDTKVLYLKNPTQLPVAWRLSGLENLGADFTVSCDKGVVAPLTTFPLHAYFRAMKPVQLSKRMIRLEISDVDGIMGMVRAEPIQVNAEAYDVALDMTLPKGADGYLDFGTVRVNEDRREIITLKNKGKYEIGFQFVLENTVPGVRNLSKLFCIIPNKAGLSPLDKPTQVVVMFRSAEEFTLYDQPILKCRVIEPSLGGGEVVASIPIKVSVKAIYCRFSILPAKDINFGALLVNSKKTRNLVIENSGVHEIRYSVHKNELTQSSVCCSSRDEKGKVKQKEGKTESRLSNLMLGMFTVAPVSGVIPASGFQTITIDCLADSARYEAEELVIDISERDPKIPPVTYKLIAEACIPTIETENVGTIYEEHLICKNFTQFQRTAEKMGRGVYLEEEKRFFFSNVIVGTKMKARFKISNPTKVSIEAYFSLRTVKEKPWEKAVPKFPECFEVEPTKAVIASRCHTFATVSFTPQSMQTFTTTFEAAVDGMARGRQLTVDIAGEGTLPRVTITRPTTVNRKGQPLLLFNNLLLGTTQTLPFVLLNSGTVPCKVTLSLDEPHHAFTLQLSADSLDTLDDDSEYSWNSSVYTTSVRLKIGETVTVNVTFCPAETGHYHAYVRLSVMDNSYEDSMLKLVGEGYVDSITLSNISTAPSSLITAQEEKEMTCDDTAAVRSNLMNFGDCPINKGCTLMLTMTNHSTADCIRFSWPQHELLSFSPQVGHLHAGCAKDISITFLASAPITLTEELVAVDIVSIVFSEPVDQVPDWDDRTKTVKWVDIYDNFNSLGSVDDQQVGGATVTKPPFKRKIVEMEAEPAHGDAKETARDLELLVSANANYCNYTCRTSAVNFINTLMFQTRVHELQLENSGTVCLSFQWHVIMETTPCLQRSLVQMVEGNRPQSRVQVVQDFYIPFSVEPLFGTISPGKSVTCRVKFSPLSVNSYEGRLVCSIPNLENGSKGPEIMLRGCSLLPVCHFDLQESNYITSGRRNPELPGPNGQPPGAVLDPDTHVIEFEVVGIGKHCIKRFNIVNPTKNHYSYEWQCEDQADDFTSPPFLCLSSQGDVCKGKSAKLGFKFVPSQLGIVESFWKLVVAEQNISIPFLLVGNAIEPGVSFDRSFLSFKPLLIGSAAVETVYLHNTEDIAYNFQFVECSCHSDGYASHLKVKPMAGQVPARSRLGVNLYFTPTLEREVQFRLVCKIQHCVNVLTLVVKAVGYSMNCSLMCVDSKEKWVQLNQRGINHIKFGNVELLESVFRKFSVVNLGKYELHYSWHFSNPLAAQCSGLSMEKAVGTVSSGNKEYSTLVFCPPQCRSISCDLSLKVSNGPTYNLKIVGHAVTPGLHFSFHSHHFGAVFLHRSGMPVHTATLTLLNRDKKNISVNCLYEATAQLYHTFKACVVEPEQSVRIPFTFYPREARDYREEVVFELNGLSQQTVEFTGTGCELKVEVADRKNKVVNLGSGHVGDVIKRQIPIVNNSLAPISFQLLLLSSSPATKLMGQLTVTPKETISLAACGGTTNVDIFFKPKARIPNFSEEVVLKTSYVSIPLFVVQGCCLGMEVTLDSNSIPFGTVFYKSRSSRKLTMTNTGDINSRFRWDSNSFLPDFSISPIEGYITPGMEMTFSIYFHPQQMSQDIRYEKLRCFLDGGPHKQVTLTLTGSCTSIPPMKEVYSFSTFVRNKDVKQIPVANRTNMAWDLTPIIDGEHWTGAANFVVEANTMSYYEVTYCPQTMTTENRHQGAVFFPFPDGTGQLFNMIGNADAPKATSKLVREVPCKTAYTEPLSVQNWLPKAQRFLVRIDHIKPDRLDPGVTIKGMDYIDVPAKSTKDYCLHLFAYKESIYLFKITFTLEQSGEYQFYEMQARFVKSGVFGSIDLTTAARLVAQHTVVLDNPLTYPVLFNAYCNVPEVTAAAQNTVSPLSKGQIKLEYMPLKVGTVQGKLEFVSQDLGVYTYDLCLQTTPARPEKLVTIHVSLGQSQTYTAHFLNYTKQRTEYTCKVDCPDFMVEKTIMAPGAGSSCSDATVDITFEPSKLGEQHGTLTLTSPVGGEYVFPLTGMCLPPRPQGPFVVKSGTMTGIPFHNVFNTTVTYTLQVDKPVFYISKKTETMRSKKDVRLLVGYDAGKSKATNTGRLTVTYPCAVGGLSSYKWIFYLKGVPS